VQRKARQTFERRQLGLTLRRLRNEAGQTQQAAAEAISRARSRVVELEEGIGTLNQDKLATLLDFYAVTGPERDTVLALGAEARKRQRGRVHTDLLPNSFQRFADLEASATEINSYEPSIVPGLLQSPGYVRAAMENADGVWWTSSHSELEERVAFRLRRQARTWDSTDSRTLRFVLTEEALRAAVGSPAVRQEQLQHIRQLLNDHNDLTVQVLSAETYRNPARGGGFTVFRFGDKGTPVGFSSWVFGPSTYFDQEADTTILLRAFDRVQELALSPEKSRQLVNKIAREA
jgi:transcriptional regulator with XRE-family HTH domain